MPPHVETSRSSDPEKRGLGLRHSAQTLSLIYNLIIYPSSHEPEGISDNIKRWELVRRWSRDVTYPANSAQQFLHQGAESRAMSALPRGKCPVFPNQRSWNCFSQVKGRRLSFAEKSPQHLIAMNQSRPLWGTEANP